MTDLSGTDRRKDNSFLDGQFLIAMPAMLDPNFVKTVVYICAHSDDGAMGFVINRPQNVSFRDILLHLDIVNESGVDELPDEITGFPVLCGGPVDSGRGFVIHSDDYHCKSSIPLSEEICLSTTQDVIKAISAGKGPQRAAMMLGYAGWGAGQLEIEIAQNAWLTCPASETMIFDHDLETKYDRAMALLGISSSRLSSDFGHA
jgi:putative transcriptional regulator